MDVTLCGGHETARAGQVQHPTVRLASANRAAQEQPTGFVVSLVLVSVEQTSQLHRLFLPRRRCRTTGAYFLTLQCRCTLRGDRDWQPPLKHLIGLSQEPRYSG